MKNKTSILNWRILGAGLLLAAGLTTTAHAQDEGGGGDSGGFFVEPALTYELGDTTVDYPSPFSESEGTYEGFGVGARLGFHAKEAIFVGVDGRYGMGEFEDDEVEYKADSKSYNWGPVVGLQMPQYGLRLWGTWVAGGEIDPDADGSIDVKFKDGEGYRLGAGFHVKSFSLNVEYQNVTYDTAKLEKIGGFNPGENFESVETDNESWIASVSFPVEL